MFLIKLKISAVVLALASTLAVSFGRPATRTDTPVQAGELLVARVAPSEKEDEKVKEPPPAEAVVFKVRSTIETSGKYVKSLAFSPDNKTLVSAYKTGPTWTVTSWDVVTGKGRLLSEFGHLVQSLTYSPDGKSMAWACEDRALKVWDVEAWREKANLVERAVTSVAFSPDGKDLISTHQDGTVRARDLATGKEWILQQHGARVFSLACSADGKVLTWGCADGSVKVWDVAKGRETGNFRDRKVSIVRLSPDGKTLAAAGNWGESVKLIDAETGKELAALKVARDQVNCLCFSPDGKTLATAGNEGTIMLWDVATGTKLAATKEHPNGVSAMAFSPDGKMLASGGPDKAIRLWDVPGR